jgi:monosaccharide-transporting ATPase
VTQSLLKMRGITKTFPGVTALDSVDFEGRAGEVHALMGENGAGKSTLIKVLTGVYGRDAGEVLFDARALEVHSPKDAESQGISTVYQEVNLLPQLTIAENICIGRQPRTAGLVSWRKTRKQAVKALRRLDLELDVSRTLSSCSIALQQMVAIARAIDIDAKLLVLDEPTSSLDDQEVEELFKVIRRLKSEGMAIIFISHFIDQVYQISDRITILRDGRLVGEYETAKLPRLEMVGLMIGKDPQQVAAMESRKIRTACTDTPVLTVKNLGRQGAVAPVDFVINQGMILSLAGLLGSGRSEVARLIFGVDKAHSGEIIVTGTRLNQGSPKRAILSGVAFTSEDRKASGCIPDLSIRENIILALQAKTGIFNRISQKRQMELTNEYITALGIKTPSTEQCISNLSGGNQQKVLLARWLALEPDLLILDEPTRGIDVGAKAEILALMGRLCQKGMAVLFISSELEEIVHNSHKVVVLRDRKPVGQLEGDDIEGHRVMELIAEHENGAE